MRVPARRPIVQIGGLPNYATIALLVESTRAEATYKPMLPLSKPAYAMIDSGTSHVLMGFRTFLVLHPSCQALRLVWLWDQQLPVGGITKSTRNTVEPGLPAANPAYADGSVKRFGLDCSYVLGR
eukprot:6462019-Amphidinium_carterae.1